MIEKGAPIAEPKGKLGVLLVGLGAVSTTFIAGVEALSAALPSRSAVSRRWEPFVSANEPTTACP